LSTKKYILKKIATGKSKKEIIREMVLERKMEDIRRRESLRETVRNLLHKIGKHSWEYYSYVEGYDVYECKICGKIRIVDPHSFLGGKRLFTLAVLGFLAGASLMTFCEDNLILLLLGASMLGISLVYLILKEVFEIRRIFKAE